jgi:1-aminocyclopropane-1-carboxylate deaminase/D-cysteine desulfhydrase-like pyridoxal-dependent ACC family enzyme
MRLHEVHRIKAVKSMAAVSHAGELIWVPALEGIVPDPLYAGKSMHWMIDLARSSRAAANMMMPEEN